MIPFLFYSWFSKPLFTIFVAFLSSFRRIILVYNYLSIFSRYGARVAAGIHPFSYLSHAVQKKARIGTHPDTEEKERAEASNICETVTIGVFTANLIVNHLSQG